MAVVDAAASLFAATFGGQPTGVWSAPGRANLIGEHTDYNGGLALPIALPRRTYAAVRRRDDGLLRAVSASAPGGVVEVAVDAIEPGTPPSWAAYLAGVCWALRQEGYAVPGLDVAIASDVPVGAGLSSSAALECSVVAALCDLLRLELLGDDAGRARAALWCQRAENEIAGAPTGGMDQATSMRATADHALLLDCRSGAVEQVPFDLRAQGLVLLVVDTRAEHALVDGQYAARRAVCEAAAATLGVATLREVDPADLNTALGRLPDDVSRARVRHVVTEIQRVRDCADALRRNDFNQVGRLFVASHASLRDDYEVSCHELDLAVETALQSGALGARMTGGGFGGSAIALVPADQAEAVERRLTEVFAAADLVAPQAFTAMAGPPARRDV
ncbi:MAG TPA: galactokinase [Lapillicoccus sp.]|nr:galactokinase [Lapillicoccus sp.]